MEELLRKGRGELRTDLLGYEVNGVWVIAGRSIQWVQRRLLKNKEEHGRASVFENKTKKK